MPRFRDLGFAPGLLPPGPRNSIADVEDVTVGHVTRVEGEAIRTGVTLIDPGVLGLLHRPLPAAVAVGNGFGKLAGFTQIAELGTLETPIALTNTLAVGPVTQGVIELVLSTTPDLTPGQTINAVVGETNDGFLNDIHRIVIRPADVTQAHERRTPNFALGAVGAGTGTSAFGWKGGIGTASRVLTVASRPVALGALVQTNFGGALTIMGVPVGALLGKTSFDQFVARPGDGSCMIVLATDAPLSARQLGRIARRAFLGLARTGSVMAHGSGDYAIAFTTHRAGIEGESLGPCLPDTDLTGLFLAAVETVEESVLDALFTAEPVEGRDGHRLEQLPAGEVIALLRRHLPR